MLELSHRRLTFSFPEVHEEAVCHVDFQRTLRIPDDNREYPLPPGLGSFPLAHVEDHASRLPPTWAEHGGVLLPMHQAEALWISFNADFGYPFALKIAAGKINAVTGEAWSSQLVRYPQDYVVLPQQPWLDGFCVQKGLIRQFVAMPLGQGYTAEEQLTGSAEHGGLQIIAYPMERERYEAMMARRRRETVVMSSCMPRAASASMSCAEPPSMGLAPGGLMRQSISEDVYGMDAWDTTVSSRCFVHLLNSAQWTAATGLPTPSQPPTAADYTNAGLPWFEHYGETALDGAAKLRGLDSVATKSVKLGQTPLPENEPVVPKKVVVSGKGVVGEGKW